MTPNHEIKGEEAILTALVDTAHPVSEVQRALAASDLQRPFVLRHRWATVATSDGLAMDRRALAAEVFLRELVILPMPESLFLENLRLLAGDELETGVDMTMASYIPVERREGERIIMIALPINAETGQISIYYALEIASETVLRAAVHPPRLRLAPGTGDE